MRSRPESVHDFFGGLASWQRVAFIFVLCVVAASLLFGLFAPRLRHLSHIRTHPPVWSAWLLGIVLVGAIDLLGGLSHAHYTPSIGEWLGYGGVPLALVALYSWLMAPDSENEAPGEKQGTPSVELSTLPADWLALDAWLEADRPARHDFLRNYAVAERLKAKLVEGTQSIGIVGPFGAGKTTIVKWIREMVENDQSKKPPTVLFSQHSCWGFEDSASAIHTMLADGIEKVAQFIDTFQVDSLPESYRQIFSAGGEWLDKVSRVIFRHRDYRQQFHTLSDLLRQIGSRLVFIVEDLDRNDSRRFDIQDVLAFLQQLKDFSNYSFVLTGGRNVPKQANARMPIDFAKLCDHVEDLKAIRIQDSAAIVCCLRNRCLDRTAFPHEVLTPSDDNQWEYTQWTPLLCPDKITPPEAICRLLDTPRSLRQALGRTHGAWKRLLGEVDWDHLLAVNVLRYSASEAFSFVLRHWDRLNGQPSNEDHKKQDVESVRCILKQDWERVVSSVGWDARAVRTLLDFILPATSDWLDDNRDGNSPRIQGVHVERYWQRVLNEVLGPGEIRDQVVTHDFHEWRNSPSEDSQLVHNLCLSSEYCDVWKPLACQHWKLAPREWVAPTQPAINRAEEVLLLSQQVISHICGEHGSAASGQSQGLHSVLHVSNRCVPRTEGNREWLKDRIREAMSTSLALANILFWWWAVSDEAIVRSEDKSHVREFVLEVSKEKLSDSQHLRKIVDPKNSGELQTLVFLPSGAEHPTTTCTDVESWKWLGPVLLDALKQGDEAIAVEIYWLVASLKADTRKDNQYQVDPAVLHGFFGEGTAEVIQLLEKAIGRLEGDDHNHVSTLVESAKSVQTLPAIES